MQLLRRKIFLFLFLLFFTGIKAQKFVVKEVPSYHISKTNLPIKIDGIPDEDAWRNCEAAEEFAQCYPSDTCIAKIKTRVVLTYDDKYLYVAAICFNKIPGKFVAQSLKRDFSYPRNDAFAIFLDPLNDNTNGYNFTVTPLGVQREGIITMGGFGGVTTAWDTKWFSAVHNDDSSWSLEIAIPFKSIKYSTGIKTWGLNFARQDLSQTENTVWSPVPKNYNIASLGYAGDLVWDEAPPKAGLNIAAIPYARTDFSKDIENKKSLQKNYGLGVDFKIGVSNNLNLDVTVNPDYSQVDVDEQIINLDRFPVFFPEKRSFFQENSDLFDFFGFRKIRPFFSRRIGLNSGKVVPIYAGARLSGKLGRQWRIGAMDMQTAAMKDLNLTGQNYGVAAIQRRVGEGSNIGALFVNRQGLDTANRIDAKNYNRNLCLEYDLFTKKNNWTGKAFYQHSFAPGITKDNYSHATWLMYTTSKWLLEWNHEFVGRNFTADVGYVPRKGYWRLEPEAGYTFYPGTKWIHSHGPFFYNSFYWDRDISFSDGNLKAMLTDRYTNLSYNFKSPNTSSFTINLNDYYTYLTFPFDPTGRNKDSLPVGGYSYRNINLYLISDFRRPLYTELYYQSGSYFTGTSTSFGGLLQYRWQPYLALSMKFDHFIIQMPAPAKSANLTLIGPKAEICFNNNFSLTTWVQYNDQQNNININSRLQWRFAPMSDLFIVYNSNYSSFYTQDPQSRFINSTTKNQALILKLTYWLNI